MSKGLLPSFFVLAALLSNPGVAQDPEDTGRTDDQLATEFGLELHGLHFVRSIVDVGDAILPACRDAPSAEWSEGLAWTPTELGRLEAEMARCGQRYDRYRQHVLDWAQPDSARVEALITANEQHVAENRGYYLMHLVHYDRGISWACAGVLAVSIDECDAFTEIE